MLRLRRRGIATVNAEIQDGIAPASDAMRRTIDISDGEPIAPLKNFRPVALIIASSLFMEQLDSTVLATALPTMARDFAVSAPSVSTAMTSYLLALAIFIPLCGHMADKIGSRTTFGAAIILFMAGSILCAQATSLWFIVIARFIQGIGGAMMVPIGRLVLLRTVAKKDMIAAMSWLVIPALVGPVVGPPIGGLFVTYLDWRWIFYINIPIGMLGLMFVWGYIPQIKNRNTPKADLVGFVISGVSLSCLLFGFEMIGRPGEGFFSVTLLAIGTGAGFLYLRHARRRPNPILDLSLLKVKSFRLSLLAGSATRIIQGATPFLLPLLLQFGFGMTAAVSGFISIGAITGSLMMKMCALPILRRFGYRQSMIVCGLVSTAGYSLCGFFAPGWPIPLIFMILLVSGFFMSLLFTAYNTIAYDEISGARMSVAISFYSTFQQLLLSMGICVGAIALQISMLWHDNPVPRVEDFTLPFLLCSGISALAVIWHLQFDKDAGHSMTGHGKSGGK